MSGLQGIALAFLVLYAYMFGYIVGFSTGRNSK